jgi:histidine ammonia-lyase
VRDLLRTVVAGPGPDRFLAPEIDAVNRLVADGTVAQAARTAVGHLA